VQRRVPHQPLAQPHRRHRRLLAVLEGELHLQLAGVLVEQEDPEGAVVDHPLGQLCQAGEQLVEIEDRRHLAADLGERLEHLVVLALALEQPRVLDAARQRRGELAEDLLVQLVELADVRAQQVQRPDHLPLAAQRDHQLGPGAGHDLGVPGIGADVVHEDRALVAHRGADDSLADLEAEPLERLGRVADGVRDGEVAALLVDEVDRERLVVGQPADELWDALEQLVEVEDGGDLPAEVEQRREELLVAGPLTLAGMAGRDFRRWMRHLRRIILARSWICRFPSTTRRSSASCRIASRSSSWTGSPSSSPTSGSSG